MSEKQLVLSVDGGGSTSKAVVYEPSGLSMKDLALGPLSRKSSSKKLVENSLASLFLFMKSYAPSLCAGVLALSGLDDEKDIEEMIGLLAKTGFLEDENKVSKVGFATIVQTKWNFPLILCSDALLPLFANYFTSGTTVISGTGSIAINLSDKGEISRFGGWGYTTSDKGSGTWIGIQMIGKVLDSCDVATSCIRKSNPVPKTDLSLIYLVSSLLFEDHTKHLDPCHLSRAINRIENWSLENKDPKTFASLAKNVIEQAYSTNCKTCEEIVDAASKELAHLASLSFDEKSPFIVLSGGLFKNDRFACSVKDEIFELTDRRATTIVNMKDATFGALRIVPYINEIKSKG